MPDYYNENYEKVNLRLRKAEERALRKEQRLPKSLDKLEWLAPAFPDQDGLLRCKVADTKAWYFIKVNDEGSLDVKYDNGHMHIGGMRILAKVTSIEDAVGMVNRHYLTGEVQAKEPALEELLGNPTQRAREHNAAIRLEKSTNLEFLERQVETHGGPLPHGLNEAMTDIWPQHEDREQVFDLEQYLNNPTKRSQEFNAALTAKHSPQAAKHSL